MDRRTFLKMTLASTATLPAIGNKEILAHTNGSSKIPNLMSPMEDEKFWSDIRNEFPIVNELLYMNNGTMGPSPRVVTERVTSRIRHVDSTGDYNGDYDGIRKVIARVLGAESGDQIAYTHNVSEAISIVASGVDLKAGDEVILTDQEHAGNMVPWLARKKRDGISLKFVTLAPNDDEVVQRFSDAITPRTRAISVPHVTCTTGQVLPIARITSLARSKNIWVLADGAHPPGMMPVDVRALGVHAYASCGHKWLCGPKGIGFLYIAPDFMPHVIPTWSGAEADKHWDYQGNLDFLDTASRYDFATQNFALVDGLHAAIDFMETIGFDKIQDRIRHLTTLLRTGLTEISNDRFHFVTPPTSLTGLTTIKLHSGNAETFYNDLMSKHKIRTRIVHESSLDANRLSVHIYTSEDDVARCIEGVKDLLG
jgi:selenocysteine lyase/cysteine desulfurase